MTFTLRLNEEDGAFVKSYAKMNGISVSEFLRKVVLEYCLTSHAEEASAEESEEILREIESLTEDDLAIQMVRSFPI